MRRLYLIAVSLLALVAAPLASGQKAALPAHFGNWSGQPNPAWVETEAPLNYVNLWKESGRSAGEFCEYSSGIAKIDVSLAKYHDPSSAYEIYTALIRPDMRPSTLDQTSAVDGDRLLVLQGSFILEVRPTPAISTADLTALVKSVGAHSDKTPLPPIRTYLPRGFIDGSQKYALGPEGFRNALTSLGRDEFSGLVSEAGFNSGAEAMFARYANGKGDGVLLLIDYPTPQLAEQHLRHLEQAVSTAARQAGSTIERNGSLLTLVLRPSSVAYGEWLRGAVGLETAVTWHEPTHTITDPPILSAVAKIIIVTGIFMLVAIVLGAAFGGVRVLTKILFPGKVFDRPDRMEVLQLGLSGKRIDPKDFY
ncbi:MAG TPA: DUF6599 family protein [Candidatus Acidoferrum sp.]|nr:DUF6599 family protein [Candidatus Acidoferrum sp.]